MQEQQKRASMQDYKCFPLYLTEDLWHMLESTATTTSQLRKLERLSTYLVTSLGLRHPSEQTQAVLVALLGRRLDALQQTALLQTVKSVLKTACTRAKQQGTPLPADTYIETLPAGFDELPEAVRTHVASLKISGVPVGVNLEEIWQTARATPLRSRNQQLVLQQAVQGRIPQGGALLQGMQSLQGMQALQQQMATQTATMVATALVGALGARQEEVSLPNLQMFPKTADSGAAASRAAGLEQLMSRAQAPNLNVGSASATALRAEGGQVPLALKNGIAQASESMEQVLTSELGTGGTRQDECASAEEVPAGTLRAAGSGSGSKPAPSTVVVEESSAAPQPPDPSTDIPSQVPTQVAETVKLLAEAHYQKSLPVAGKGKGKGRVRSLKKPAAACAAPWKRPASAQAIQQVEQQVESSQSSISVAKKRPATAGGSKSVKRRPASAVGSKAAKNGPPPAASAVTGLKKLSEKERFERQPHGCSSCRGRSGCCRSCWAKRGFLVK